jgi:hypothetical protein
MSRELSRVTPDQAIPNRSLSTTHKGTGQGLGVIFKIAKTKLALLVLNWDLQLAIISICD